MWLKTFVQREIYEPFKAALLKRVSKLKIGDPKDEKTNMGAVVSEALHAWKYLSKIKEAKKLGGKILIGGNREFLKGELKNGYYVQPTVIENLPYNCSINQKKFLVQ